MSKKLTKYNVIASSSSGNAVIYHDEILVDVGIAYKHLEQYLPNIKYILLTHEHGDHFNKPTIKRIHKEYPEIKFIAGSWLTEQLEEMEVSNYSTIEVNEWYLLGDYRISSFGLYHDVPNIGYRIFKDDYKIFHATDTGTLEGITAVGYDLYMLEHNHYEQLINEAIDMKIEKGIFAYEIRSKQNHLSVEQAEHWLKENNIDNAEVVKLHKSDKYGKED